MFIAKKKDRVLVFDRSTLDLGSGSRIFDNLPASGIALKSSRESRSGDSSCCSEIPNYFKRDNTSLSLNLKKGKICF